ncbi:uncharacterized protein LOC132698183 [Cylas formicarius]|uniref:uncharacterized protein LOC132698183 n=1 Tax=Cylas formicarius TaxID=197179 RepID=UPI002958A556|nr:uncharacterized protein LOC132698183 [Cylas formicarius]
MDNKNTGNSNISGNPHKKPRIKQKAVPVIKHTKTSLRRLLIANPLLEHEEAGTNRKVIEDKSNNVNSVEIVISGNAPLRPRPTVNNIKPVKGPADTNYARSQIKNKHLFHRRSRSHETQKNLKSFSKIVQSHEDIAAQGISNPPDVEYVFKTPTAYKRRSIFTPQTVNSNSSMCSSTPAPMKIESLEMKLFEWLKRANRPLSVHHLKCFGLKHDRNVAEVIANKENIDTSIPRSESYENLFNISSLNQPRQVKTEMLEVHNVAKEALSELHNLICEGYPIEQCVEWLQLMKNKHNRLDEEPEYWECRAAIEQFAGNISSAVECYKTAIVQGAEVNNIDKSLDELLKKFSLLNITPTISKDVTNSKRQKIICDARNIFKSTIIQFAVQERKLRKNKNIPDSKLVVTPVRRSARLSTHASNSTQMPKIFNSLKTISPRDYEFKKNEAIC